MPAGKKIPVLAKALEASPGQGFASLNRQQQRTMIHRQRERLRRATKVWERQRAVLMRLLLESMEEFSISPTELSEERRKRVAQSRGER